MANYDSCFKFTHNELAANDYIFILGIDLGQTLFQHAIFLSQDFYKYNEEQKFQNFEFYIGPHAEYEKNVKCAGGPF